MSTETPDPSTLEGLIAMGVEYVQRAYETSDPDHEIPMQFIAFSPENGLLLCMTPLTGETEREVQFNKTFILMKLRNTFNEQGVTHYINISESWTATVTPETPEEYKDMMPSERPDRVETVHVVGASRSGEKSGVAYEIVRSPDAAPRLGTVNRTEGASLTGIMTELLD